MEDLLPKLVSQHLEDPASVEDPRAAFLGRPKTSCARAILKCRCVRIHSYSLNGMVHEYRITVKTHLHKIIKTSDFSPY